MAGVCGARERVPGGRTGARWAVTATEGEAEELRALAAGAGVSVPRLMVETTLAARGPVPVTRTDRGRVLTELMRMSDAVDDLGDDVVRAEVCARLDRLLEVWRVPPPTRATRADTGGRVAAELRLIRRQIGGAAVNINQAAKVGNSTGEVPVDVLRGAVAYLRALAGPGGRLERALAGLGAADVA